MTGKVEVVKVWNTAAWANPPESTLEADKTYLSEDFKSFDRNGNVIVDKNMLMGITKLMSSALLMSLSFGDRCTHLLMCT